jgi:hypothetical protein
MEVKMLTEALRVLGKAVAVFEELGIPYYVGGSIASIAFGTVRNTLDADLVAEIKDEQVASFAEKLSSDFYVDESMIRDAVERRSSFNLIHHETSFKIDVFIRGERPYNREQFRRRTQHVIDPESNLTLYLASPEDIILAKLEWYEAGKRISSRQWEDVLGVLTYQQGRLDYAYLRRWAGELSLIALFEQALTEVISR